MGWWEDSTRHRSQCESGLRRPFWESIRPTKSLRKTLLPLPTLFIALRHYGGSRGATRRGGECDQREKHIIRHRRNPIFSFLLLGSLRRMSSAHSVHCLCDVEIQERYPTSHENRQKLMTKDRVTIARRATDSVAPSDEAREPRYQGSQGPIRSPWLVHICVVSCDNTFFVLSHGAISERGITAGAPGQKGGGVHRPFFRVKACGSKSTPLTECPAVEMRVLFVRYCQGI